MALTPNKSRTPNRPEDIPVVTAENRFKTLWGATGSGCARVSPTQPLTRWACVRARTMAGTGRAERSVATGSPASNSSERPVFTPTVVVRVVCPGKLHAFAENAKVHLPLSDITDSWNPRTGRRISRGSARETEPAEMVSGDLWQGIDLCNCGGESETPSTRRGCVHGRDSSSQKPRFLGLPAA